MFRFRQHMKQVTCLCHAPVECAKDQQNYCDKMHCLGLYATCSAARYTDNKEFLCGSGSQAPDSVAQWEGFASLNM